MQPKLIDSDVSVYIPINFKLNPTTSTSTCASYVLCLDLIFNNLDGVRSVPINNPASISLANLKVTALRVVPLSARRTASVYRVVASFYSSCSVPIASVRSKHR